MPNKLNARYHEWKIFFEGILSKLDREDEITLVGGSLGGCFLLKYFSEK
jgi:predicted alpha/beta-fold hydrolase